MGVYWDKKEQYFREFFSLKDLPADRRANLRLLEAMLDRAYSEGYKQGLRDARLSE